MLITNNHATVYLWWKEKLAKHEIVPKYYKNDCSIKPDIDKLDVDKLEMITADLSKLSNVVKNMFLKRLYMMNWFKKLTIETINLIKKTEWDGKIKILTTKLKIILYICYY